VSVIAQQYSSANFDSLRFHFPKEKLGALLKECYLIFLLFFNTLKMKLRNLKVRKSGIACTRTAHESTLWAERRIFLKF